MRGEQDTDLGERKTEGENKKKGRKKGKMSRVFGSTWAIFDRGAYNNCRDELSLE